MNRPYGVASVLLAISSILFSCSTSDKKATSDTDVSPDHAGLGRFTKQQVSAGSVLYAAHCETCHGNDLRGSEGGSALTGDSFISKWKDKSVGDLYALTRTTMPKTNPQSLDDKSYASLLAFIFHTNGFPVGDAELPVDTIKLQEMLVGAPSRRAGYDSLAIENIHKQNTFEGEWLQHRGDYASTNYSPLDQINRSNAKDLKIVWRWKTDNFGPTPEFYFKSTPIMAKGILYTTAGRNRSVAAIDCETGETLWTYRHDESERAAYVPRKNSGRGVAYWPSSEKGKDRVVGFFAGFILK
jgi:hypothetical protein